MKKDEFLSSDAADELSRQLTELRVQHHKVNLDNAGHDPDLSRLAQTLKASRKKSKGAKPAFSKAVLKKLAGV